MEKRKLEELSLIDNYLWGSVMNHEEYKTRVAKIILERLLVRKV